MRISQIYMLVSGLFEKPDILIGNGSLHRVKKAMGYIDKVGLELDRIRPTFAGPLTSTVDVLLT